MSMELRMNSEYFYETDADQFSFIRIPKQLLIGEEFLFLPMSAKILYGLLLDKMSIATKNRWIDEKGRVYILYQLTQIQKDLNVSRRKACYSLKELEEAGLVQKELCGNGKPTKIYIKNFSKQV